MEKDLTFKMTIYENGKQIETANVSVPIFKKTIKVETIDNSQQKRERIMTNPFNVIINQF